jgi:hypothetical protein
LPPAPLFPVFDVLSPGDEGNPVDPLPELFAPQAIPAMPMAPIAPRIAAAQKIRCDVMDAPAGDASKFLQAPGARRRFAVRHDRTLRRGGGRARHFALVFSLFAGASPAQAQSCEGTVVVTLFAQIWPSMSSRDGRQ